MSIQKSEMTVSVSFMPISTVTPPETMDMGRSILNQAQYKANRVQAMKDQADFETYAYSVQDEMIAEKNNSQEVTE